MSPPAEVLAAVRKARAVSLLVKTTTAKLASINAQVVCELKIIQAARWATRSFWDVLVVTLLADTATRNSGLGWKL